MHWAIRSTQSRGTGTGFTAAPTSGGFIYVDSNSIRRSGGGGANAAAASTTAPDVSGSSAHSMSNSASALARAFGIIVREVRTVGYVIFIS